MKSFSSDISSLLADKNKKAQAIDCNKKLQKEKDQLDLFVVTFFF